VWYRVKFIIDEQNRKFSRKHVDLAILDLIISQVVISHQVNIRLWRIHRRYGQHEFLFDVFCADSSIGQAIQTLIINDTFSIALNSSGIATNITPSTEGHNVTDISDSAWPDPFKEVWPKFAQRQSELQLELTQFLRGKMPNSPTIQIVQAMPLANKLSFYQNIQQQLDKLWYDFGSHAFIHHKHSFFAYQPFLSSVTTRQLVLDIS